MPSGHVDHSRHRRHDGPDGEAGPPAAPPQLLFFDTFSHEMVVEELNLDLVQFPLPVVVDEIRVIPLGARVQANFPGGVRLGATNPARFKLELFVNDLSSPGASTFQNLGVLDYDDHRSGSIRISTPTKIPTDGLVLRGLYSTITLAVYGSLSAPSPSPSATDEDQVPPAPPSGQSPLPLPASVVLGPQECLEPSRPVVPPDSLPPEVPADDDDDDDDKAVLLGNAVPPPGSSGGSSAGSAIPSFREGNSSFVVAWASSLPQQHQDQQLPQQELNGTAAAGFEDQDRVREQDQDQEDHGRNNGSSREDWYSSQRGGGGSGAGSRTTVLRSHTTVTSAATAKSSRSSSVSSSSSQSSGGSSAGSGRDDRTALSPTQFSKEPLNSPGGGAGGENQILSDVSDISEGDIPVDDDDDDFDGEDRREVGTQRRRPLPDGVDPGEEMMVRDRSPLSRHRTVQDGHGDDDDGDGQDDVEEISDEDAEWSDDGDAVYGSNFEDLDDNNDDNDENDYFEDNPVKAFDMYNTTEVCTAGGLRYFGLTTQRGGGVLAAAGPAEQCADLGVTLDDLLQEAEDHHHHHPFDHRFVEKVEQLLSRLEDAAVATTTTGSPTLAFKSGWSSLSQLEALLRSGLSLEAAMGQPKPTDKIRHLKSSLKLLLKVLELLLPLQEDRNSLMGSSDPSEALTFVLTPQVVASLGDLLTEPQMSASMKLLVLQVLDLAMDHQAGAVNILRSGVHERAVKSVVVAAATTTGAAGPADSNRAQSCRVKRSLVAFLSKVNLFQVLEKVRQQAESVSNDGEDRASSAGGDDDDDKTLCLYIGHIRTCFEDARTGEQQPPPTAGFFRMMSHGRGLESLLALLVRPRSGPALRATILELLHSFSDHDVGIVFLASRGGPEVTNLVLRALTSVVNEQNQPPPPPPEVEEVITELSLTVQAVHMVDRLCHQCAVATGESGSISCSRREDLERPEVLEAVQALHGITFSIQGRLAVVKVLARVGGALEVLVSLVRHSETDQHEDPDEVDDISGSARKRKRRRKDMKRSAIRGYACELLLMVVRLSGHVGYLERLAGTLMDLGRFDETSRVHELVSWVSPVVAANENGCLVASEPALLALLDCVKDQHLLQQQVGPSTTTTTTSTAVSHELITAVRCIDHALRTSNDVRLSSAVEARQDRIRKKRPEATAKKKELIIRLFAAGAVDLLLDTLANLCSCHEQPHLHTATFVGQDGFLLLSVIRPVVRTLSTVLGHLARCQAGGGTAAATTTVRQDPAPIRVLLRTCALCSVVPASASAAACASLARLAREDILDILLTFYTWSDAFHLGGGPDSAYPCKSGGDTSSSSAGAIGRHQRQHVVLEEVLKYTLSGPHTYMVGLGILSELMPVPLPVLTATPLTTEETLSFEAARRVWSLHAFGAEPLVREAISTLGLSQIGSLLHLLRRVCVQLADLSAPVASMVVRAIVDGIRAGSSSPGQPDGGGGDGGGDDKASSYRTAKMLNLLMWLASNGPAKAAFFELVSSSQDNSVGAGGDAAADQGGVGHYQEVPRLLASFVSSTATSRLQCLTQEYAVGLMQVLFDPEVSLVPTTAASQPERAADPETTGLPDENWSDRVPPRDQYVIYLKALVDYVCQEQQQQHPEASMEAASAAAAAGGLNLTRLTSVVRTLAVVACQEFGLPHLKNLVAARRPTALKILLGKVVQVCGSQPVGVGDSEELIAATVDLLRVIGSGSPSAEGPSAGGAAVAKEDDLVFLTKSLQFSPNSPHPLRDLSSKVALQQDQLVNQDLARELSQLVGRLDKVEGPTPPTITPDAAATTAQLEPPVLADPRPLSEQFRKRAMYELAGHEDLSSECDGGGAGLGGINGDPRISVDFWLSLPPVVEDDEEDPGPGDSAVAAAAKNDQPSSSCVVVDLVDMVEKELPEYSGGDLDLEIRQICDEKLLESQRRKKRQQELHQQQQQQQQQQLQQFRKRSAMDPRAFQSKNLVYRRADGGLLGGQVPPPLRGGRGAGFHHRTASVGGGGGGQRSDSFRSRPANTSRPPSLHVDDFLLLQMRGQQPTGPTGYNKQSVKAAQELFAEREAKSKGALVGFRDATPVPVFCQDLPSQGGTSGGAPPGPPARGYHHYYRANHGVHNPRGPPAMPSNRNRGGSGDPFAVGGGPFSGRGGRGNGYWTSSPMRGSGAGSGHYSGRRFLNEQGGGQVGRPVMTSGKGSSRHRADRQGSAR